jgi:hypothetical protein
VIEVFRATARSEFDQDGIGCLKRPAASRDNEEWNTRLTNAKKRLAEMAAKGNLLLRIVA